MTIVFERIGRTHDVPNLEVPDGSDQDYIAMAVFDYARKYLRSSDYFVSYRPEDNKGYIEAGRFGKFSVAL